MTSRRWTGAVLAALVLAACAHGPRPALPSPAPSPTAAKPEPPRPPVTFAAPLSGRPGYAAAELAPALAAFRRSCPALLKRTDASGLTLPGDWTEACAAAATTADPAAFFATSLRPVTLGDGRGLDTGYFEPELAGSRVAAPGFAVPLYRRPPDLIDLDLGAFDVGLTGKHVRGRIAGTGFVPYYDRAAIDDGALGGRGLELAYAADPYERFSSKSRGRGDCACPMVACSVSATTARTATPTPRSANCSAIAASSHPDKRRWTESSAGCARTRPMGAT